MVDYQAIKEQYRAPKTTRRKFSHPGRSSQALNTSGAGIVHREMMDLQRQPKLSAENIDKLKGLRRDWNRNRKYTDAGMSIAEASTKQDAKDYYSGITKDFSQKNKSAYDKMYPISTGFTNYVDGGGMFGLASKAFKNFLGDSNKMGSDILNRVGIGGAVPTEEATEEVLNNYAKETFGFGAPTFPGSEMTIPYPHQDYLDDTVTIDPTIAGYSNRPLPSDLEQFTDQHRQEDLDAFEEMKQSELLLNTPDGPEVINERETALMERNFPQSNVRQPLSPLVDPLGPPNPQLDFPIIYPQDTPINTDMSNNKAYNDLNQAEIDYIMGRTEEIADEELSGYVPDFNESFNDTSREAGLMAQHGLGAKYANNSMNYLNEYKKALASGEFGYDTPGGMMSYDEFVENYERMHSLPRGLHLGE